MPETTRETTTGNTGVVSIDDLLRHYADALIAAACAEQDAGPRAETDPDVDRAWEVVAHLRTRVGLHIRGLEDRAFALAALTPDVVATMVEVIAHPDFTMTTPDERAKAMDGAAVLARFHNNQPEAGNVEG